MLLLGLCAGAADELRSERSVVVHPDGSFGAPAALTEAEVREQSMAEVAQLDFGQVFAVKHAPRPVLTLANLRADPLSALHSDLSRPMAVSLMILLMGCTVALHIWLCNAGGAQFAPEVQTKAALVYAAYIGIFLFFQFVMRYSSTTHTTVSALDVVGACSVVKIGMSACLYGQDIEWSASRCSREVLQGRGTIFRCGIPGVFYVTSDLLRAYCLLGLDMASFNAVIANRTIVTALLWVTLNNASLSGKKWMCLVLMSAGTYIVHQGETGTVVMPEARFYYAAVGSVVASCVAAVINERLLKTEPVCLNLQNLGTYCIGLIFLVCGAASQPGSHVNPLEWFRGDWGSYLAIATLACLGIVTAHFLKLLSNLWKEVAIACQVVISFVIETLFFGTTYTLMTGVGVCIVFFGMSGFAMDGMHAEAEADIKRACEQEPLVKRGV